MSRDEHRQAFLAFVAGLIGTDFDRYHRPREDRPGCATGLSYNLAAMWLDDAELAELAGRELAASFNPASPTRPSPDAHDGSSPPCCCPGTPEPDASD